MDMESCDSSSTLNDLNANERYDILALKTDRLI
jgi:hypothetical protein